MPKTNVKFSVPPARTSQKMRVTNLINIRPLVRERDGVFQQQKLSYAVISHPATVLSAVQNQWGRLNHRPRLRTVQTTRLP